MSTKDRYTSLLVTEPIEGSFRREVTSRAMDALPKGDVLVRVQYSSLNYKDGLSATGNKGVTKSYPHVPGVDAAGIIEESGSPGFSAGDQVIVTGYDLGSNTDGGWAEYVRVPAEWVVNLPRGLTLREAMIYGSAGLTAGLSVHKLMLNGVRSNTGHVLVTGATGGVGCLAVALLAHLGFHVVAATGKREEGKFLTDLGAREVIGREEATDRSGKALLSAQWVGVVDTVGGQMLETAIRRTKIEGTVACCGNIGSVELHTSIYPFILRGVTLAGIGSAFLPSSVRNTVWQKLSNEWRIPNLDHLTTEVSLDELNRTYIDKILHGKVRGRILVNTQVS